MPLFWAGLMRLSMRPAKKVGSKLWCLTRSRFNAVKDTQCHAAQRQVHVSRTLRAVPPSVQAMLATQATQATQGGGDDGSQSRKSLSKGEKQQALGRFTEDGWMARSATIKGWGIIGVRKLHHSPFVNWNGMSFISVIDQKPALCRTGMPPLLLSGAPPPRMPEASSGRHPISLRSLLWDVPVLGFRV